MRQQIRFCQSPDGVRIAYATMGAGPPLVWVNSWLTHLELDMQSPIQSHWFEEFSRDHLLVRYDARGNGLSDRAVDAFSVDDWVRDLETVADDLELQRFCLVGFCQGGATAVTYAVRHPERISQLILHDSYAQGAFAQGASLQERQEAEALADMIAVGWGRDNSAFRELFANLLMPDASKEQHHWLGELQRQTVTPETAVQLWRAFHSIDVRDVAPLVTTPSLVLHIQGDNLVPFEKGRQLAALIPRSRFVPLDSRNHMLMAGEPAWDRFLVEVRAFLGMGEQERPVAGSSHLFPELTSREWEILALIAQGASNERIADELVIAPKTARNHVSNIYSKLAVTTRAEAIVLAREAGLGK